jgi:beta-lactamase regulating signal transducer with metallopeptidase domain
MSLPLVILIKATLLLVGAAVVDAALRGRGSAAARHLVWTVTIVALLILPAAAAALPSWTVRVPVPRAAADTTATRMVASACADAVSGACATPMTPSTVASSTAVESVPKSISIAAAAIALYVGGIVLLLARLGVEPFALRRLIRESRAIADGVWSDVLAEAARDLGVIRRVRLLHSAREIMPLTFGTLVPTIVLPASADAWTSDRLRAVLLHELAHIARRDCFVQRLTAIASAVYWPHPGVWWAARRLRVERELACDDRVLAAGAGAREYAGHLLDLAHSLGSAPAPATALGMARPKQLERRLLAVLDAARNRSAIRARGRSVAIATALAVLLPIAVVRAALVAEDAPATLMTSTPDPEPQSAPPAQELAGTWELRLSRDPGMAQVTVRTEHGNHGRSIPLDRIPVSPDQITAASATIRLPITLEAGTFNVDGVCRRGVCGGTFAFEPSQAFAAELAKRGFERPSPQQAMDLALANVGLAYLDALAKAGYAKPTLADIVRAAQHGVDAGYLRDMTALGYRVGTLDALTRLRDHGVDPTYIKGIRDLGYPIDSPDELTRLRDHGIDPTYIHGMADSGFAHLTVDELLRARDHGVDPRYMKGMRDLGYGLTGLDAFVKARDHGIDPDYVGGLASLGYGKLTMDQLLRARDHGVDARFIREMSEVGYKGVPLDGLIRMRDHGVDAAFVRRVNQKGLGHLSVDELIDRRDRGMDDPDAAARAIVYQVQSLWRSIVAWARS